MMYMMLEDVYDWYMMYDAYIVYKMYCNYTYLLTETLKTNFLIYINNDVSRCCPLFSENSNVLSKQG